MYNINNLIEIEERVVRINCLKICEEIKTKYKSKFPNVSEEEINEKSRKETYIRIAKESEKLRDLRIQKLIEESSK